MTENLLYNTHCLLNASQLLAVVLQALEKQEINFSNYYYSASIKEKVQSFSSSSKIQVCKALRLFYQGTVFHGSRARFNVAEQLKSDTWEDPPVLAEVQGCLVSWSCSHLPLYPVAPSIMCSWCDKDLLCFLFFKLQTGIALDDCHMVEDGIKTLTLQLMCERKYGLFFHILLCYCFPAKKLLFLQRCVCTAH